MKLFESRRSEPEWKNPDPKIRRSAVAHLQEPALLSEILKTDPDDEVRERARESLLRLALEAPAESGLAALEGLSGEESRLFAVARSASAEAVARAALERLREPKSLGIVARQGRHASLRRAALDRIGEAEELAAVALKSEDREIALGALERLVGILPRDEEGQSALAELLRPVADRAHLRAAARRARGLLREGEHPGEAAPPPTPTDRKKQTSLCEAMETLARSGEVESLAEQIAVTRSRWIDLVPAVDEDLEERFEKAYQAAKEQVVRNQEARAESRRRAAEESEYRARQIAPRIEICEKVEKAEGATATSLLEEALDDWKRLGPPEGEQGWELRTRFEAACAALEERGRSWKQDEEAQRTRAEQEAAHQRREREERRNFTGLQQLTDRLQRLLSAEGPALKALERGDRDVRELLREPGPLPSGRDSAALLGGLKKLQRDLAPRIRDLRLTEDWRHWANAGIQEELCREAESLREVADPAEAAKRLTEIQKRWRNASAVSREQAGQLWLRFKAARDEVRSRLDAYRTSQIDRKEALCAQAESLAPSSEWIKTAESLKLLQEEWKSFGSVGAARDRALWQRFRAACDQFFTRRKEDLKQRRHDWAVHLAGRKALCEKAEAMADSTDWDATSTALKKLQAEWKTIGPVSRKDSEAIWQRFRGACDRFFERYKRRHEIAREARRAEREKICAELEHLLSPISPEASPPLEAPVPAGSSSDPPPGGVQDSAVADSSPDGAAAATETSTPDPHAETVREPVAPAGASGAGPDETRKDSAGAPSDLLERLRAIRRRWEEEEPIPGTQGVEMESRFRERFHRVLSAFAPALSESEFDVERNRSRMMELCDQIEKLAPGSDSPESSGLSPASRLAAMWVEAMAANTIGGGVSGDARVRAALEEVKRAQAAWEGIGYVAEEDRRPLAERFDRACRKIQDLAPVAPAPPPSPIRVERKR